MSTELTSNETTNSHNNPPTPQPSTAVSVPPKNTVVPTTRAPSHPVPAPPADNPVVALIPPALRERRFRALSFAAILTDEQRTLLFTWLGNHEYSIEQIRQKIAAPPPEGFGMKAQPTTLRRLRKLLENDNVTTHVADALDTAQDLFEDDSAGTTAPLREALSLMLYARAVRAAKQQAEPAELDRLVSVITKLEKLNRPERSSTEKPSTTRHRIELTVLPPSPSASAPPTIELDPNPSRNRNPNLPAPRVIQINSTPLPEEGTTT